MNLENQKLLQIAEETPEVDYTATALALFPEVYTEKYKQISEELKNMTEEELEAEVKPSLTDRQLRVSLWTEVRKAVSEGRPARSDNVYSGICTRQNFYNRIVKNHHRFAWIMRPQRDYTKQADEIIDFGLSKLRDALNCKVQFNNGHMDTKAVKVMLDILSYFEARTKGPLKQKIEIDQKTVNTNVTIDVNNSMDEIERRIEEARKRVAEYEGKALIQGVPEAIDVQASE